MEKQSFINSTFIYFTFALFIFGGLAFNREGNLASITLFAMTIAFRFGNNYEKENRNANM